MPSSDTIGGETLPVAPSSVARDALSSLIAASVSGLSCLLSSLKTIIAGREVSSWNFLSSVFTFVDSALAGRKLDWSLLETSPIFPK